MIGAFKLNTIAYSGGVVPESYFILTNSSTTDQPAGLAVDANKNIYSIAPNNVYKITETGSISWQKQLNSPSGSTFQPEIQVRGSTVVIGSLWPSASITYPYGYIALNQSDGTQSSYISIRSSSGSSGYGNAYGSSVYGAFDSSGVYHVVYDGAYNSFSRLNFHKNGSWLRSGINSSLGYQAKGIVIFSNGNVMGMSSQEAHVKASDSTVVATKIFTNSFQSCIPDGQGNALVFGSTRIIEVDNSCSFQWGSTLSVGSMVKGQVATDSQNNIFIATSTGNVGYIYKLSSTGSLLAKLQFTANGSLSGLRCHVANDNVYVSGLGYVTGTTLGVIIMKLPNSLSVSGTYGNIVFSAGTHSVSSYTETINTSPRGVNESMGYTSSSQSTGFANLSVSAFTKTNI